MVLFNTIIGPNGLKLDQDEASWKSQRMTRAFKLLIYFSEIFPKKYWSKFMRPNKPLKAHERAGSYVSNRSSASLASKPDSVKIEAKTSLDIDDNSKQQPTGVDFFWSNEYITVVDQNFDELFKDVYEEILIDRIFGKDEIVISRSNFITAISNPGNELKKRDWIFKPSLLATCFQENMDLIKVKQEIEMINIDYSFSLRATSPKNLII